MRTSHLTPLIYILTLISVVAIAGCMVKPKAVTKEAEPVIKQQVETVTEPSDMNYEAGDKAYPEGYYIHTVSVPAENISIIAKWYTGDQKNWSVLAKCNPKIKPNRIFLGDKIKIPRSILTRKTPFPPEFIQQFQTEPQRKQKKKNSSAKTKTTATKPTEEEAPLLFGPKGF